MAGLNFQRLRKALEAKGFAAFGKSKHPKYAFMFEGRRTPIQFTLRHGRAELSAGWLSGLATQLRMPGTDFLKEFITCDKREQDFIAHLRSSGVL